MVSATTTKFQGIVFAMIDRRARLELLVRRAVERVRADTLLRAARPAIDEVCQGRPPLLLAVGKAAPAMAGALAADLPALAPGSLVTAVTDAGQMARALRVVSGDHPLPGLASAHAAHAALAALASTAAATPILLALSGGASAAWCAPAADLKVDEVAAATRVLMQRGATIQQLNCVRRHLSAIQGGWLAAHAAPRPLLTLALVDIVDGAPHDVGSGPGVGDPTSHSDALAVVDALTARTDLPPAIVHHLMRGADGALPANPQPDDPALVAARFFAIATPATLRDVLRETAVELGLPLEVDRALISGRVEPLADALANWVRGARSGQMRGLVGEITLTLPAHPGRGGRAHHLALAVAARLRDLNRHWALIAVGSDGLDGNSGAAGTCIDDALVARIDDSTLEQALTSADSATLLAKLGAQIVTGPTGTNLTDVIAIDVD